MTHKIWQRLLSVTMLLGMLLAPFGSVAAQPLQDAGTPPAQTTVATSKLAPASAEQKAAPAGITRDEALAKIHPDLRDRAKTASPSFGGSADAVGEAFMIQVMAAPGMDLSAYFLDGKVYARPVFGKGEQAFQFYLGRVFAPSLLKLASLEGVSYIIPMVVQRNAVPDDYPFDDPRDFPQKGPADWAALQASADKLRAGSPDWNAAKAFGDGREPLATEDWFEVMPEGPHKSQSAWSRGYTGAGVTVAVLDDGIDAAHPDLMGTQKIYSSTLATQYNGWPMVFSPFSAYLYFLQEYQGIPYIEGGYFSAHYVDTTATPTLTPCGVATKCFSFTPLIDVSTPGTTHTYIIDDAMTTSGVVHVGTHPDFDLRDYVWGERPAVLVTDPNTPGVYDTVYVDLDDDYDFRDEKPLTKADPTNPATYNDMISYRDMNGDGLADISGGMLYFIGDGTDVIPATDYMWGADCTPGSEFMCPGNGDLVAFSGGTFDRAYSHGTQCASNVVGQGVTQNKAVYGVSNDFLPSFRDLAPGPGKAAAAVYGQAPDAEMVNVSDIYYNHDASTVDAYLFTAVGYDGRDQTGFPLVGTGGPDTDPIFIASNSYGHSDIDNDGFDFRGQVVSQVQRWWAPYLQMTFSTGNGAPGYGTAAPPSPETAIGVGASSEYGSTGWDTITDTNQIMNNDVVAFSNSGPGAREGAGPDVLAGGAFAAGDEELNYYAASTWGTLDGNLSWVSWGGTSRSAPTAMGVLALIYQAYYDANGTYPTNDVAKAIFMSSATDLNSNVFRQGAGSVNADVGTAIAGGLHGVYMGPGDSDWQPGDFHGTDYPGFSHVVFPGGTYTKTFTVYNDSASPVTVDVSDSTMMLVDSVEIPFTVTGAQAAQEQDNFYKAFQYMIPITATAGNDASWYNVDVPKDADLMVVRMRYPMSEMDVDGDYSWDNRFYLMVYNWKDVDGDGIVWQDKDSNGVVNFVNDSAISLIDYGSELQWDNPVTELDRYEYGRFGYNRPVGNTAELMVHDPYTRMHDGLFIGLRHHPGSTYTGDSHLTFRIEFYKKADVSWLTTDFMTATVPAGGSVPFVATIDVPVALAAGDYEAAIEVFTPGDTTYADNNIVVPVVMNVADAFSGYSVLGGYDQFLADWGKPYNNAAVRGYQEWSWRAESGDWRFFYMDTGAGPVAPDVSGVSDLLVKTEWEGPAPNTDNDTIVLGPTDSQLGDCWYCWEEPSYYGPYILDTVAKSPNTNISGGTWLFDTSSGANEDWVIAPYDPGELYRILQHNVKFEGDAFEKVFTTTVGLLNSSTAGFNIDTYKDAGTVGDLTLDATLDLNGLVADAYLGVVDVTDFVNEPVDFVSENTIEWTTIFTTSNGVSIDASTSSPDISDIDLYVFYSPDGSSWEQRGSSTTGTANEHVNILNPEDGYWLVGINNWSGPAGHFNLHIEVVSKAPGVSVSGLPTGALAANTPVTLTIDYDAPMLPGFSYDGVVTLGPPEAPSLLSVPVTINRYAEDQYDLVKTVDNDIAFAGDSLVYTLDLYKYDSATTDFTLTDALPADVTFSGTAGDIPLVYDAGTHTVSWSGTLTQSAQIAPMEGFEDGVMPPSGWSTASLGASSNTWELLDAATYPSYVYDGAYGAWVNYDSSNVQDEWLYSPVFTPTVGDDSASFVALSDTAFPGATVTVYAIEASGAYTDTLWDLIADESWSTFDFRTINLDLSAYQGENIQLAWQYHGLDGDSFGLDNISLPGKVWLPSASATVTVVVSDTVHSGQSILNTASLVGTHNLPQESQVDTPASDSASFTIGGPNMATSAMAADATASPGGLIAYDFTLTNSGTGVAAITLTNPVPAGTIFYDFATSGNWSYDALADEVTWIGTLAPGETKAESFYVMVDYAAAFKEGDTITSNATVEWDGTSLPLSAQTQVVFDTFYYLPFVSP